MPPTPINSETILLSFLCGSLVVSFLLAALSAVFKVYRPLVPVGDRLRKAFARDDTPEMPTPGYSKARVELVDNGFQNRESLVCGILGTDETPPPSLGCNCRRAWKKVGV